MAAGTGPCPACCPLGPAYCPVVAGVEFVIPPKPNRWHPGQTSPVPQEPTKEIGQMNHFLQVPILGLHFQRQRVTRRTPAPETTRPAPPGKGGRSGRGEGGIPPRREGLGIGQRSGARPRGAGEAGQGVGKRGHTSPASPLPLADRKRPVGARRGFTYTRRGAGTAKPCPTAWHRGWDVEGEGSGLARGRGGLQTNIQAREGGGGQNCPQDVFNVGPSPAALPGSRGREPRDTGACPCQGPPAADPKRGGRAKPSASQPPRRTQAVTPASGAWEPRQASGAARQPGPARRRHYAPTILCLFSAALRLKMLVCWPASGR